jgi:hypothetical protein
MDEVIMLDPSELPGFDGLFARYCEVIRYLGDRCWGYIEIDQGGRENKMKTRARLEQLGFRPIPVYHPLLDGWDYFDYLAERYDRICFGNMALTSRSTRLRLAATAWERRRKYPHLWIHLLGLTTNEISNAYPLDSCDSSTWNGLVRWPDSFRETAANQSVSNVSVAPVLRADGGSPADYKKAKMLGAYAAMFRVRNWQGVLGEYRKKAGADQDGYLTS